MKEFPTIMTKSLKMRALNLSDAKIITDLANDKEVAKNAYTFPYPCTEEFTIPWITTLAEAWEVHKFLTLGVETKKEKELIGAICLNINSVFEHAEIGYWSGRPYWGKGYSTEAHQGMLHYGFGIHKLHRIFGHCLVTNLAIKNICLNKLYMKHEGRFREHIKRHKEFVDVNVYGILDEEYNHRFKDGAYGSEI